MERVEIFKSTDNLLSKGCSVSELTDFLASLAAEFGCEIKDLSMKVRNVGDGYGDYEDELTVYRPETALEGEERNWREAQRRTREAYERERQERATYQALKAKFE